MDIYIIAISFIIPFFILLIIIEEYIAYRKNIKINRAADIISSLSSGITNVTRDGAKLGFILISYSWLVEHITIYKLEPLWLAITIAFIIEDFAGYWFHRMNHRINFFWNRHVIHHSSEEFNLACALRQSISDNIKFHAILFIPAALLGIPATLFAIISPIHLFMQFWYHTQLIDKMGFLEKILVTPSHHRVHHAINEEYLDKNYSQIFIVWDKLFGTFQEENKLNPPIYGIIRPANTWNPIVINFKHLLQILKDAYRAENFKDKVKIWFMPTGWRPDSVKNNFKIEYIDDLHHLKKYDTNNSIQILIWSWIQLFFAGFIMFLILLNISIFPQILTIFLCLFLFLHISSYTFLLDENKWALIMEFSKFLIITLLLLDQNKIMNLFILKINLSTIWFYSLISLIVTCYFWIKETNRKNKLKFV